MSTPGADELGRLLSQLVADAGLSAAEAARRAGKSTSTMSRYLLGQGVPKPDVVRSIATALGVADSELAAEALRLAKDLVTPRVVLLRPGTLTAQSRWQEIEAATSLVRDFAGLVVPGLLQTVDYAKALFAAAGQVGEQLEANVRARTERQQRLADPAHRFVEVLSEGALRWHVLGPGLMAEQCDAIARRARADDDRVRVGIIPWTRPGAVFPLTNFTVYDERAVIVGTDFGTATITAPRDVVAYVGQHDRLCELAVFGEGAAREAERVGREYRGLS